MRESIQNFLEKADRFPGSNDSISSGIFQKKFFTAGILNGRMPAALLAESWKKGRIETLLG